MGAGTNSLLSRLPILEGLEAPEIAKLLSGCRRLEYQRGEYLCREGTAGHSCFFVERGEVEISKGGEVLASLSGPTVIGELALIDDYARSADARSTSALVLYRLDKAFFQKLRAENDPAAYKLLRNISLILCDRLRATNQRIDAFFSDPVAAYAAISRRVGGIELK